MSQQELQKMGWHGPAIEIELNQTETMQVFGHNLSKLVGTEIVSVKEIIDKDLQETSPNLILGLNDGRTLFARGSTAVERQNPIEASKTTDFLKILGAIAFFLLVPVRLIDVIAVDHLSRQSGNNEDNLDQFDDYFYDEEY
jgi:hypothetical protein